MTQLATRYTLNAKIRETPYTELHRGYRNLDGAPVVVKLLRNERPSPLELARLRHEYEILVSFEVPQVVKPLGLERHGQGLALVMEDTGEESLDQLIRLGHLDLQRSLVLAVAMAQTVAVVHAHHIIHKDIKPEHFFLHQAADNPLVLVDFGIATWLSQQAQAASPLSEVEGTLAYVAPEQTGRMNRIVDWRSDLYSLGVTLYELFTGCLPFEANDPLELVHCHIARSPRSPRICRADLPVVLSELILKLLAKTAEERYQSAAGVQHDLERCLEQLKLTGRIEAFQLAEFDSSGELSIPQKLYGREQALAEMLATLERAKQGTNEFLLLTGEAGVGKSALVNELHPHVVPGGYFAPGKFDYLARSVPYGPISHVCHALVQSILAESPADLERRRRAVLDAAGPNGQLLIDLVPELQLVIGAQPEVPSLGASESQHRFELVFVNFLRAFASREHLLVIFLDDLQWADASSLRLLQQVLQAPGLGHLLIIGAYRKHEVNAVHPLSLTLQELGRAGVTVGEIELKTLALSHIAQLLGDTLGCAPDTVDRFSQVLLDRTSGNPFFIAQFLATLHRDQLLVFDHENRAWKWDLQQVAAALVTDNVVDFMLSQLQQLPAATQEILRLAACVGHQFDGNTLSIVSQRSRSDVAAGLWPALRQGLIVPLDGNYRFTSGPEGSTTGQADDTPNAAYRFLHDRVQQAAYSLLSEGRKVELHLKIGQLLLGRSEYTLQDSDLFKVADHLNRGAVLMTDSAERKQLAYLNYAVGRKARGAAAPDVAVHYLKAALELLGQEGWTTDYEIVCPAHLIRAECEYLSGNLEGAFALLQAVEHNARTLLDRAEGSNLEVVLLTNTGRLDEACTKSADVFRMLGGELPALSDEAAIGAAIGAEFAAYQASLTAHSVESLAELACVTEPEQLALLDTMANAIPAAFQGFPELHVLLVLKGVRLLCQATAPLAGFFYEQYAIVHMVITGDHETAFRFGQLGLDLATRAGNPASKGPVHYLFGIFISHLREHISRSLDHLRSGYRISLEHGNQIYAACCASLSLHYRIYAGENLDEVQASVQGTRELADQTGDVINQMTCQVCQQMIRALKGQTLQSGSLQSADFDEATFEATAAVPALAFYGVAKAMVLYMAGRFREALAAADHYPLLPVMFYNAEHVLYRALSLAEMAATASPQERPALLERLHADAKILHGWAQSVPANHAHRSAVVQAELARVEGRRSDALELYDRAIALAQEYGFLHEEALANELAARHHLDQGRKRVAGAYVADALYGYDRWCANSKVTELRTKYGQLLQGCEPAQLSPNALVGKFPATVHRDGENAVSALSAGSLDLATAIRATEAIATELVVDRLLERLMRTLLENAGAQRGLLVINRGGVLALEATMSLDPDTVRLGLSEKIEDSSELPLALVQYVTRTREPLVLADATRDLRFASDPYIARERPRSVLCLAMLQRGNLMGVLYLENNIATKAFSPSRCELLQFLAAQAAVAFENARLYGELNAVSDELRRTNENLEALVAERTTELRRALTELWSEMDLARKIQTVLLPEQTGLANYETAALMVPTDSVGGDYYDVIRTGDSSWILIGDVSGHGVTAGLIMMMVQTAVRAILLTATEAGEPISPAILLSRVNRAVRDNLLRVSRDDYMTITALELVGGTVRYSGLHQDILVHRARTNTVECFETSGMWVGIEDDITALLQDQTMNLDPGDTLLLFTDGITECVTDGRMLETQGLVQRFHGLASQDLDPAAIVKGILGYISGRPLPDDVTVMAIRYRPTEAALIPLISSDLLSASG